MGVVFGSVLGRGGILLNLLFPIHLRLLDYICSLSHIGYVYVLPVLLAYINRPLLYIYIL